MAGDEAETKACPWCAETILAAAKKCKHCGEFLTEDGSAPPVPVRAEGETCSVQGCESPSMPLGGKCAWHTMERGGRTSTEPPFGGSVWEFAAIQWRCLAHGKAICTDCRRKAKPPTKAGKKGDRFPAPGAHQIVCPHCQTKGQVRTQVVKQKKGISGGKATAAVMTAGLSTFATGLSRKEEVTEAHCNACGSTWHFA
jgi:hypothetical protein